MHADVNTVVGSTDACVLVVVREALCCTCDPRPDAVPDTGTDAVPVESHANRGPLVAERINPHAQCHRTRIPDVVML